jgi:cysteine synthase B
MRQTAPTLDPGQKSALRPALLDHIGATPLLALDRLAARELPRGVALLAKAEHLNPSGSLKDRPAKAMILAALADGRLAPGRSILDATSGNAGIAYAMIGAALGYPVTLCLPADATPERKRMLRIYGARVVETDPAQGSDGAQRRARELFRADPGRYFYADQYNNHDNWLAHYRSTAEEIWVQTRGRITHFVAGVGTAGLFTGTVRRLKERRPSLQAVAVQPDGPGHRLAGLKHMATAMVPGIYDPGLANAQAAVSSAAGLAMTRRLARDEGLLTGPSTGANLVAALQLAAALPPGSVVVTVLFDSGARYLGEPFWEADSSRADP